MNKHPMSKTTTLGLVVEGTTEYYAIPLFLRSLGIRFVTPSIFNGQQSKATIRDLVEYRLIKHVLAQLLKASGRVIVVLDRENRTIDAEKLVCEVQQELLRQIRKTHNKHSHTRIAVCVADRKFENWLLADPDGISQSALLRKGANLTSRVACHADDRDALRILQETLNKGWYEKSIHGPQLAKHIRLGDPKLKYCSRSFLTFLKTVKNASVSDNVRG